MQSAFWAPGPQPWQPVLQVPKSQPTQSQFYAPGLQPMQSDFGAPSSQPAQSTPWAPAQTSNLTTTLAENTGSSLPYRGPSQSPTDQLSPAQRLGFAPFDQPSPHQNIDDSQPE